VREGQFLSSVRLESPSLLGKPIVQELKPVPVENQGSVLLPLHPVNRIQGLKPGQQWRMTVVNPLSAAALATAREKARLQVDLGDSTRYLQARVLPELRTLPYEGRPAVPCLVIEYKDEEMTGHTWVEEATGRVLRQEAESEGQHWVMQRN